jgi:hypothetical protein
MLMKFQSAIAHSHSLPFKSALYTKKKFAIGAVLLELTMYCFFALRAKIF